MDLSKIHKNPYATPGSDKVRFIFLVSITVIVVVAFIYFKSVSEQQADKTDQDQYPYAPVSRREVYAKVDPARIADVKDESISERVVKEMEPFLHLIQESAKLIPGDMELLGAKVADPKALRENPAAFRGQPFSIKGNLQWWESEQFQDFELYRGYITTLEGEYVYFTVLQMPADIALGDIVKLNGFFFKVFSFIMPQEDTRISDALFLVGKRLITSFYEMDPVAEIDMNLLDSIFDYQLESSLTDFQEKPLYHLLSYVHNMDDETFRSTKFSEHLATEIRSQAAEFRGQPVDVVGQLVWLCETLLGPEGENPIGIRKVHRGIVYNYIGKFCYFFALDIPDGLSTNMKELVHLKGIFFRNYSWATKDGKTVSAPTLVVRGFEKFVIPEDNTMVVVTLFIIGMTILIVSFFFFTVYQDRKRNREYRARFIEKKKEQLKHALAAKTPPPSRNGGRGDGGRPVGDGPAADPS